MYVACVATPVAVILSRQQSSASSAATAGGGTHTIVVQSADTKAAWMTLVQTAFNAAGLTLSNGQRAAVSVVSTGYSGGKDGSWLRNELTPAVWSPQATDWVPLQESSDSVTYVKNRSESCRR